MLTKTNIRSV